jgi:hypothetical protein
MGQLVRNRKHLSGFRIGAVDEHQRGKRIAKRKAAAKLVRIEPAIIVVADNALFRRSSMSSLSILAAVVRCRLRSLRSRAAGPRLSDNTVGSNGRLEFQGDSIHAVALPSRFRPVVEHVAEVTAAAPAMHFRSWNDQAVIVRGIKPSLGGAPTPQ